MCLTIKENQIKTCASQNRKVAYKVVEKDNKNFVNIVTWERFSSPTRPTTYILGSTIESSRKELMVYPSNIPYQEYTTGIASGFHMFNNLKDAKKFINYIVENFQSNVVFDFGKLTILECSVSVENHVADGIFDFGAFSSDSSVYHTITPVKEINMNDPWESYSLDNVFEDGVRKLVEISSDPNVESNSWFTVAYQIHGVWFSEDCIKALSDRGYQVIKIYDLPKKSI